jgi:serine/threonine-protein kinase Stk1
MTAMTKRRGEKKKKKKLEARQFRPSRAASPVAGFDSLVAEGRRDRKKDNRFLLERRLGAGGLCEVFAARDLLRLAHGDGTPRVAVKRLLPEYTTDRAALSLLAREFFIGRHAVHPSLIRYYDLHEEEYGPCLSMELLHGERLYDALDRYPHGMGTRAQSLAYRLFEALTALHASGVAHGDVKPANIMLEKDGRAVLFDFNTADALPLPGRPAPEASAGLLLGLRLPAFSPLFASPERLAGGGPSFADDIFAACCSVYQMLSGVHPFKGRTAAEARETGLRPEAPQTLGGIRRELLLKGLAFEAERRPKAGELAEFFLKPSLLSRLLRGTAAPYF